MENIIGFKIPDINILNSKIITIPIGNHNLFFKIPSLNDYWLFEYKYLNIIFNYFQEFVESDVFSFQDITKSKKFKKFDKKFLERISDIPNRRLIFFKTKTLISELNAIIKKYFTADFNIKKIHKFLNPIQYLYVLIFIHAIVFTVKKNHIRVLRKATANYSTLSIFSSTNMERPKPRFKI